MQIRLAKEADLPQIRTIYDAAKSYMDASGNPNQWVVGYPPEEYLSEDITLSRLYVCEEDATLHGVFLFDVMEDPTYHYIEGAWMNDAPYGVIHRIASKGTKKGHLVEKCGFERCGIIYLANGSPRIAYQLITKSI